MGKLKESFDLLGRSSSFFPKMDPLCGDMTLEIYGSISELVYCYPPSKLTYLTKKSYFRSTLWANLRPMYCYENKSKKAKTNHHLYRLQEIKAEKF